MIRLLRHPSQRRWGTVAAIGLGMLCGPALAAGQTLTGTVLDTENGLHLEGVTVALLDTGGSVLRTVVTDRTGHFTLDAPAPGTYGLRAERIGYSAVVVQDLVVGEQEVVEVEVRLGVAAVEIEALTVVARRPRESLAQRDMRQLRERIREFPHRVGVSIFPRSELERIAGFRLKDVLRLAGARRCSPKVYWNGMRKHHAVIDLDIPVQHLEAVEFYSGTWVPGRAMFVDEDGCGVTLIWTRQ